MYFAAEDFYYVVIVVYSYVCMYIIVWTSLCVSSAEL